MFSHILVTCVGNICRSPMAEAVMQQQLQSNGHRTIEVRSAGIHALSGHAADPHAIGLMEQRGLDITQHRGQQLTDKLVRWADLILVMEEGHRKHIEARHPIARGRVFRLLENAALDIPDPYRLDTEAFEQALELIDAGINEWLSKLFNHN